MRASYCAGDTARCETTDIAQIVPMPLHATSALTAPRLRRIVCGTLRGVKVLVLRRRDEAVVASFHARRVAAAHHRCGRLGAARDGPDERAGDRWERSSAPGRYRHRHSN